MNNTNPTQKTLRAFKIIPTLLIIIIIQAAFIFYLWHRTKTILTKFINRYWIVSNENIIKKAYPSVDFSRIYPDLTPTEIDRLQREFLGLRFVYSPFVETKFLPVKKRFVTVTKAGFRKGRENQPWPPQKEHLVVFVFGGSTTFSVGLPDAKTVVSELQEELSSRIKNRIVQCYNFGTGYYFSTQEMILFLLLLQQGRVPDLAIFIDGFNDFYFSDGLPTFTRNLYDFTAPDLPSILPTRITNKTLAVSNVIQRYRSNLRMIEAIAREYGVSVIFVGQPIPHMDFNKTEETYPCRPPPNERLLCQYGYGDFKKAGLENEFGNHFIWCGDAFSKAASVMYADSIHYSYEGAKLLANCIVQRALQKQLLPNKDQNELISPANFPAASNQ